MKLGNFNGIEARIAEWEKKYPLADFINPEIIRKIKAILNKDFLTRLIGDCLAAKILHEKEKQLDAYKKLKEIIDSANKTKNYKKAVRDIQKWKEDLGSNGLSIYSFDRYYRPKVCSLLLIPSKEIKNQEEATQKLKELKEKGSSLDSKTFSQELNSWQNRYCITNFPDKLQNEINETTATLLKSIHEKTQEEQVLGQLQIISTSSSENNPLDSIASILSQYDYTHFSDDAKKQIENITQKAVSLNENLNMNFNFDEEDINTISKNSTSTLQFRALSDLKDIFSRNSHDLEGLLNWIYVNRKTSFTEFARSQIVKHFVSAGYKIPSQSSYYIPEININLTDQNFSKIDDIRMDVILNYLGIISQGNTISTTGKDNLEQIHITSEQENIINETPTDSLIVLPVYDNTPQASFTTEDTIYNENGAITENNKDEIILVIEDFLNDSATTYEIPTSKPPEVETLSKENDSISETVFSTETLADNSTEEETTLFEIPVYDTTKIINVSSEEEITGTSSSVLEQSSSASSYTLPVEEKEKTNITNSILQQQNSASSYTSSFEYQDETKTTNSEEQNSSISYTMSIKDQENLEHINNESSYITIAYPIIFEALSRTSKTLEQKQDNFESEKNNDF